MKFITFLSIFFVFITKYIVLTIKFPSGITFCQRSDPNFDKCFGAQLTNALRIFKDGDSSLGIPKLDPFFIPKMEVVGDPSASISLNQKYENVQTYGISTSEVYEPRIKIEKDDCFWDFMVLTPTIYSESDYQLNGQLLMVPINGHGKSNVSITNLRNHHQAKCEIYEKKGQQYLKLTSYKMNMKGEKIVLDFANLFEGNQKLSDQIRHTINENSQEIFNDLKFMFEEVWSPLHLQTANHVLSKFPLDELFPK